MEKKHAIRVRVRAFRIWQKLGFNPWRKQAGQKEKKRRGDFYRGAFDSIPFLNKDARRTFSHLLLRPGYMIRDYIRGDHENYLAPLTALIVFFAFFALVSSVLNPQPRKAAANDTTVIVNDDLTISIDSLSVDALSGKVARIVQKGYIYLNLDRYPEAVHTPHEASLAALESTLRSQGIPLFLGKFFLLWLSMCVALRRFRLKPSAMAAASAYVLCQFSFFMIFAIVLTWGRSSSVGIPLMALLLVLDYRQWLGLSWGKSIGRTVSTGFFYGLLFLIVLLLVSALALLIALCGSLMIIGPD